MSLAAKAFLFVAVWAAAGFILGWIIGGVIATPDDDEFADIEFIDCPDEVETR